MSRNIGFRWFVMAYRSLRCFTLITTIVTETVSWKTTWVLRDSILVGTWSRDDRSTSKLQKCATCTGCWRKIKQRPSAAVAVGWSTHVFWWTTYTITHARFPLRMHTVKNLMPLNSSHNWLAKNGLWRDDRHLTGFWYFVYYLMPFNSHQNFPGRRQFMPIEREHTSSFGKEGIEDGKQL